MLQDYEHRPQYFPETISSSKLLCRTGADQFQYSMRMKEPAVLDVDSDVVWERSGCAALALPFHLHARPEAGKDHGYLRRLNSYWRFAETPKGVFVEAETITLSDEFGSRHADARVRADGDQPGEIAETLAGIHARKRVETWARHSQTANRSAVRAANR